MNLDFGNEYADFRNEVQSFCKEYKGIHVTGSLYSYESVIDPNEKPRIEMDFKERKKVFDPEKIYKNKPNPTKI